jgi:hypothetical protein
MATYTLKSAVASVTPTSGSPDLSADLFTATGQTVVKSIVCSFSTTPISAQIKIQKSGGSAYTYNFITTFIGGQEVITANGTWPSNYLVLETGDKLIINCVIRYTSNVTMVAVASYTVIS